MANNKFKMVLNLLSEIGFLIATVWEFFISLLTLFIQLVLAGLVLMVIFLFFGSMIFEFLDKIGGK